MRVFNHILSSFESKVSNSNFDGFSPYNSNVNSNRNLNETVYDSFLEPSKIEAEDPNKIYLFPPRKF
jgi:hypothetical protein